MKQVLVILVTAVAAAVSVCAVALAAKPPTEVSVSRTAAANDQTLVEAKCPHGKHPVSGGYELESNEAFAANSAEGIDLRHKRWSLNTVSAEGPTRVTAHAYCSPLGGKVEFRSDQIELNQGDSATLTPTCKRAERVLSGGYAFSSSGLAIGEISESFRADPRSWSVKGTDFSDKQVTLLAFANCVPKEKAPKLRTERAPVPFNDEGPTTTTATCGAGRYALSGGYKVSDNLPTFFVESRRAGTRGWRITEGGGVSGRDANLTALAYCAKG